MNLSPLLQAAAGTAAAGTLAAALTLTGVAPPAALLAFLLAALALVGLCVALNSLLRLQGLGGEGLVGAAGVLGAALVLLGGALPAATGASGPGGVVWLEIPGLLLLAGWVARAGWSLRRLLAPAAALGWGSVATGLAIVVLLALELAGLSGTEGGPGTAPRVVPFLPLVAWSAGIAAVCAAGRPVREPPQE